MSKSERSDLAARRRRYERRRSFAAVPIPSGKPYPHKPNIRMNEYATADAPRSVIRPTPLTPATGHSICEPSTLLRIRTVMHTQPEALPPADVPPPPGLTDRAPKRGRPPRWFWLLVIGAPTIGTVTVAVLTGASPTQAVMGLGIVLGVLTILAIPIVFWILVVRAVIRVGNKPQPPVVIAPTAAAISPPAGWYTDETGVKRWFDGQKWTEFTRD